MLARLYRGVSNTTMATIQFVLVTDEGEEIEHTLPARNEVCSRCEGEGTHVNPAIDGNGITASEWAEDWDEESRENYMSGVYDVPCEVCNGDRVVRVVDEDRCTSDELKAVLKLYDDKQRDDREYERECAHERRMGY